MKEDDKSRVIQSVRDPLTCSISKKGLKQRFLESALANSLTVSNFGNTLAMTIFFFFKLLKIWWKFHKFNKISIISFSFLR